MNLENARTNHKSRVSETPVPLLRPFLTLTVTDDLDLCTAEKVFLQGIVM